MHDPRILIVANDADAGSAYLDAIARAGGQGDLAHNFEQMSEMAKERPYNGFLIDILTLVRCSKDAKVIAYESINLFPVLRVKWDPRGKKIKLSPLEQSFSPDSDAALRFFIESRCRLFPARSLRRHTRKPIHLNLWYGSDPTFPENAMHRSFAVNLSIGGLFLHTMEELAVGATVWLRLLDTDPTPIAASVRWTQRWGDGRFIPGAGLQFETLTEMQRTELTRIITP